MSPEKKENATTLRSGTDRNAHPTPGVECPFDTFLVVGTPWPTQTEKPPPSLGNMYSKDSPLLQSMDEKTFANFKQKLRMDAGVRLIFVN
jgi:hypothetical protein